MGNRRRKDEDHNVGDSMPGTVGDSDGAVHDRRSGPTFYPDEAAVPESTSHQEESERAKRETEEETSESDTDSVETEEETTRMKYAEKYGDSWPEDRQRRFLREHDVSAKEMGWKLTE